MAGSDVGLGCLFPFYLSIIFLFFSQNALSETPVDTAIASKNYLRTRALLEKIVFGAIPTKKAARMERAKALFALISLERLVGSQKRAHKLFERLSVECNKDCRKLRDPTAWKALNAWAYRGKNKNPKSSH